MVDQAQTQQNLPLDNNNWDKYDTIVADQVVGLRKLEHSIFTSLKQREELEMWIDEVEISNTHPFVRAIYIFLSRASSLLLWQSY